MVFDEIVVGSGLAALGVVLGLPPARRVLVIAGSNEERLHYYDAARSVLCARVGYGGLGQYWHGVIPTGNRERVASEEDFERLFRHFYPRSKIAGKLGNPWLFVPWYPIRPHMEWNRLLRERGDHLGVTRQLATRIAADNSEVAVHTSTGIFRCLRVWVAAGALHTPELLTTSFGAELARGAASDHIICYLGQIDRSQHDVHAPRPERTANGAWFPARYAAHASALCTLRPARFAFRRLDYGIEQRSIFGMPTGSAVAKLARRASLGLLAEALYNRTGLFPGARVQSVYAQILVPDAYWLDGAGAHLTPRLDNIQRAIDIVHSDPPWEDLRPSRCRDIFLPAIHLHHTVNASALAAAGCNAPLGRVQVVDASVHPQVGPEHHSFKVMAAAASLARKLSDAV